MRTSLEIRDDLKFPKWIVANITGINSVLYSFINEILVCYRWSQMPLTFHFLKISDRDVCITENTYSVKSKILMERDMEYLVWTH
jgi:hypothetical protein